MNTKIKNSIFNVRIDNISFNEIVKRVMLSIKNNTKIAITYVNIHVLNCAYQSITLRNSLNSSDIVYCDGFGVKLAGFLKGLELGERITGAQFIYQLCEILQNERISIYILAGKRETIPLVVQKLISLYPDLQIVGSNHGFFEDSDTDKLIDNINRVHPSVLFVGLGTPRQEVWVAENKSKINANVIWCVGALFDYVGGKEKRGPDILVNHGFEWLYRFYQNPKKMWQRYLIGIPMFFWRVFKS